MTEFGQTLAVPITDKDTIQEQFRHLFLFLIQLKMQSMYEDNLKNGLYHFISDIHYLKRAP